MRSRTESKGVVAKSKLSGKIKNEHSMRKVSSVSQRVRRRLSALVSAVRHLPRRFTPPFRQAASNNVNPRLKIESICSQPPSLTPPGGEVLEEPVGDGTRRWSWPAREESRERETRCCPTREQTATDTMTSRPAEKRETVELTGFLSGASQSIELLPFPFDWGGE